VRGASETDPWYSDVPVSDEKQVPDRDGDASSELGSGSEADELDELDQLDGDGFDQAVAQARAAADGDPGDERPFTEEEAGLKTRFKLGRSPIISAAVIVVGLFLLAATWSDFRYFLRALQSEPRDLGRVSDIYQDGEFSERFDNQWVTLEGDPDVQHAARMQGRDSWIGFMRLTEGDASMFVAVPRATEKATNEYPGRFTGRMRRVSEVPQWERLETFFNAEEILDTLDLAPASFVSAVASGEREIDTAAGGSVSLSADDQLRIIVRQSAAVVQLGRTTWPTRAAADETMRAFGRPWTFVDKRDTVWVYAVEVGADAKVELFQDLTKVLNGGKDLLDPDPKVGGLVLPRRATYLANFSDLQAGGGDLQGGGGSLSFTYAGNTAEPGYRVQGDVLVPVELDGGRLSVPVAQLEAARLERSLVANPDGYLLMVEQEPIDVWPSAVMFFAVFGVVALNAWALYATLRRRT
jgi:hypothetical protein